MRDDPNLFKVVGDAGINVADQFHSQANAEQYVEHFVCGYIVLPQPKPREQGVCLIPEGCGTPPSPSQSPPAWMLEVCGNGIDNDADGFVDEYMCSPPNTSSPGQQEYCDTIDNDADGFIDEDCPPSQLPQESESTLPDFGAGEPPAIPDAGAGEAPLLQGLHGEALETKILFPRECVSYTLFSSPKINAMTCAQVVDYSPSSTTGKIYVLGEQWVGDNKVYDGVPPRDTNGLGEEVFKGMIGEDEIELDLHLRLNPDTARLYVTVSQGSPTPEHPPYDQNIFTWALADDVILSS